MASFVMPAEAGIQPVVGLNNFKDLDSRFRGNDVVFPIATQSLEEEGKGRGNSRPGLRDERDFPREFVLHQGADFVLQL
jgi:hypothetical protein